MMKWGKKQEAKWAKQRQARDEGREANMREFQECWSSMSKEQCWVKDRKTGEWYDPKVKFKEMMDSPEVVAVMRRLKGR